MQHRSDIDGLRALAVAPIVLFHAHVPGFDGGYVGVDIFFVISGYLITAILAAELDEGRFSFAGFYARRVRRLLPALAVMLAIVALIAPFLLLPDDLSSFASSLAATALLSANILFWSQAGYFDVASDFKPLLHIWSLSIEEQFYLVFPLALYGLYRADLSRRAFVWIALLVSLGLSIWLVRVDPSTTFYWLHTRAFEFLIGSVIALGAVPLPRHRWLREALAALGLAMILLAIFTFGKSTAFPGESALLPCLGAALLIATGDRTAPTLVARGLSLPPVVWLGLISYSLYLWHWPITVFFVYGQGKPEGAIEPAFLVAASLALGFLSWRFVEQPFRSARKPAIRTTLVAGGAVCALLAIIGIAASQLALRDSIIERFYGPDIAALRKITAPRLSEGACIAVDAKTLAANGCLLGDASAKPSVAVIGDSFADVLNAPLSDRLKARGLSGLPFVFYSCPSILGTTRDEVIKIMPGWVRQCRSFVEASIAAVLADPAIRFVVMSNNYDWYLRRLSTLNGMPLLSADGAPQDGTIQVAAIEARIEETVRKLTEAGKTVIFVGASPSGRDDFSARAVMLKLLNGSMQRDEPLPAEDCRDLTADLAKRLAENLKDRFVWIEVEPLFVRPVAGKPACLMTRDKRPLTSDGSHLAGEVVEDIVSRIDAALGRGS